MLEVKEYKNWKEVCKVLKWNGNAGGNTKKKYLKELDSLCKWYKQGNKIIIEEIYSEQKEIVDNRKSSIEKCGNFDYFLIYSYLFNQLFVGGNKPLKQEFPLNPKEKDLYRTEINRLKTENRELRKENKKLRKANEDMEKRIAELEAKLNAQSENDEEE